MKLPKLFGKKGDDEDLEDEDSEVEEPEADEEEDGEDEEDEDGEPAAGGPRKRLLIVVGGASVAVIVIVGVAALWFLGGDDGEGKDKAESDVPRVVVDIPPKVGGPGGGSSAQAGAPATLNVLATTSKGPAAGVVVAPVTMAAYGRVPMPAAPQPLAGVPDAALVEQSSLGPLPKVGADGRKPWQVYARPMDLKDDRPRISIVIIGLGLSRDATDAAINRLPGPVTLAFDPYATGLDDWVPLARQAGHEILLGVPMEPHDFPARDPGPQALMTSVDPQENLGRLTFLLSRLSGYIGIITVMGSHSPSYRYSFGLEGLVS